MPPPAEGFASRLVFGPALRTQPDRRLVTLVREGYEVAFEEIVRRYGKPLTGYAAAIVGGRSEDVTQDAFSKALLALRRDDAEIELRPWLFRIVRNTALNDLRDSPPSPEVLAEAISGGRNPAEELERREELADLIKRLRALPEPQRAAIVMRELEGLGHEEIAAALGLSGGAARQAIYRARQALRDGAAMLLPLPLLKAILEGAGAGAAETAAGAASVGGAGVALKATAATVLVVGAVGAGVAIDHGARTGRAEAIPPPSRSYSAKMAPAFDSAGDAGGGEARLVDRRRHSSPGEGKRGNDQSGHRKESGEQGNDSSSGPGSDHEGIGSDDHAGSSPESSHSGSSGHGGSGSGKGSVDGGDGSGDHGGGSDSGDHSGHSGSGPGEDHSGHGGTGSGVVSDSHDGSGPGDAVTESLSGDSETPTGSGGGGDRESHSGNPGSDDLLGDSYGGDGLSK